MSVQIDPVHDPLQFLSLQQMQDVRAQETIAPEGSLPNETLKLSDYRMSYGKSELLLNEVPDNPLHLFQTWCYDLRSKEVIFHDIQTLLCECLT